MSRAISGAILAITLWASLLGGLCVGTAQRTYRFSVAFVVTAAACSLLGIVAVVSGKRAMMLVQDGLVALSVVLFVRAVANWSGGDDGPGMALIGGVGPPLLAGAVLAMVSTILVLLTGNSSR